MEKTEQSGVGRFFRILIAIMGVLWLALLLFVASEFAFMFLIFTLTAYGDITEPWTLANTLVHFAMYASFILIPLGIGFLAIRIGFGPMTVRDFARVTSGYWTMSWSVMFGLVMGSQVLNKLVSTRPVLSAGWIERGTTAAFDLLSAGAWMFVMPIALGMVIGRLAKATP
ncbi:MAG: hypothetical protein AAF830_05370 [Pseudomonadota bacterium]